MLTGIAKSVPKPTRLRKSGCKERCDCWNGTRCTANDRYWLSVEMYVLCVEECSFASCLLIILAFTARLPLPQRVWRIVGNQIIVDGRQEYPKRKLNVD